MTGPKKVMLIAGEVSGDNLGAGLIKALREAASPCPMQFFGAGGAAMEAAGMQLSLDLTRHAVVGVWEVLKNYSKFRQFFNQLLGLAQREKPDAIVLIDYPGFNLRFTHAIRKITGRVGNNWSPKLIYYVSPQIWAWHESRVRQISKDIDLMLSIFPFEKNWYSQRSPNFKVEFIGHPLIDRYPKATEESALTPKKWVTVLPGSRIRELKKHYATALKAAEEIALKTGYKAKVIFANEHLKELSAACAPAQSTTVLQTGGLADALRESVLALAASGTVTVECAYFGVPTVVFYRTSWLTYTLGKRFIKVPFLAMPNLLANERIYPEFIQKEFTSENLVRAGLQIVNSPEQQHVIKTKLAAVVSSLGEPGASDRAAAAILKQFANDHQ